MYYIGTVDGHNLEDLVAILQEVKKQERWTCVDPHITEKDEVIHAEDAQDKYHGVSKFDLASGEQSKSSETIPTYTKVFADALIGEAVG